MTLQEIYQCRAPGHIVVVRTFGELYTDEVPLRVENCGSRWAALLGAIEIYAVSENFSEFYAAN